MKITEVTPICLRYTYNEPIMDGCNTCKKREAFLLQVKTDVGIEGIGEAATFGLPLSAFKAVLEGSIAPLIIGENPLDIEFLWERLLKTCYAGGRNGIVRGVASAVDIALWDILGKSYNKPVFQLLGAERDRIPAYASAGFYQKGKTPDDLKREFTSYMDRGYKVFKMKVGRTKENYSRFLRFIPDKDAIISQAEDRERVQAVRGVIGKDTQLMLDMNGMWDECILEEEIDFLREMKIFAVEEPMLLTDTESYVRITNILRPILRAAGENVQGLSQYKSLIEGNVLDLVQANLGWSGGITEGKRIADFTAQHGKLFAPHSFFSAVLTAANVHLSASLMNVPFIEAEENPNPLRDELVKEPIPRDRDMAYILTDAPGLGVELDERVVERYFVR